MHPQRRYGWSGARRRGGPNSSNTVLPWMRRTPVDQVAAVLLSNPQLTGAADWSARFGAIRTWRRMFWLAAWKPTLISTPRRVRTHTPWTANIDPRHAYRTARAAICYVNAYAFDMSAAGIPIINKRFVLWRPSTPLRVTRLAR